MVKLGHVFGIMLSVGCALNIPIYIYILLFVRAKSNAQLLGKYGSNRFNKNLTRTVTLICIYQVAFVLPYIVFLEILRNINQIIVLKIMPWFNLQDSVNISGMHL